LLSNGIGAVKVLTLLFVAILGFVVLGGHTKVEDPQINFRDSFAGTATAYGATNAVYRLVFSYGGFENAFNVVNEVKNPVKQLKKHSFIALTIVAVLYMLANVAYFAAGKAKIRLSCGVLRLTCAQSQRPNSSSQRRFLQRCSSDMLWALVVLSKASIF